VPALDDVVGAGLPGFGIGDSGFGSDANDGDRGRELGGCKKHDNERSQQGRIW
jgi:hypothetical protein